MSKKIKDSALEIALTEIKNTLLKDDKLPKEYDGYAASLGPAILTSGLLPSLAFYSDGKKNGLQAVLKVIAKVAGYETDDLLRYVLQFRQNRQDMANRKKEILMAVVAVKLAMRNFPHTETSNA